MQTQTADFLVGLGPHSAASEIFQECLSLTFDGTGVINLPHFVADFHNAGFVAENAAIPVTNFALDAPNPLSPHKASAIALLSRELVEFEQRRAARRRHAETRRRPNARRSSV